MTKEHHTCKHCGHEGGGVAQGECLNAVDCTQRIVNAVRRRSPRYRDTLALAKLDAQRAGVALRFLVPVTNAYQDVVVMPDGTAYHCGYLPS